MTVQPPTDAIESIIDRSTLLNEKTFFEERQKARAQLSVLVADNERLRKLVELAKELARTGTTYLENFGETHYPFRLALKAFDLQMNQPTTGGQGEQEER